MNAPSTEELLAFLLEHEFLTPSQVQELRQTGGLFADVRALARELVGRDWLTPYQANQLLQGQGSQLLLGPYRLVDRLGVGGMGLVFKAHHRRMDRTVAIKIIPTDRVSDPVAVARFEREVRAVAKLSHPNIVTAFEVNQAGETHFLAMEYVDGIDLARLVQQSGPLEIPNACDCVRQAAVGLQHAHEKGLVHRDIKPGNLMVARPHPDDPPIVKILDFGLARFERESPQGEWPPLARIQDVDPVRLGGDSSQGGRLTQLGSIIGTVDYIAPEQVVNPRTADIRADIYSLGCSLFYLLTGAPPFPCEDPYETVSARMQEDAPAIRKVRPEVPPSLERVVAKMMALDPKDRYQTPGEVAQALEPHTAPGGPGQGKPVPLTGRALARKTTPQAARNAPMTATSTLPRTADSSLAIRSRSGKGKSKWLLWAGVVTSLILLAVGMAFVARQKPEAGRSITNSIGMKLAYIPAGKFMMDELGPDPARSTVIGQREVEIAGPFYMGAHEVTQEQYTRLMPENPSRFKPGGNVGWDLPVDSVTWDEANTFCKKLSELPEEQRHGRTYRLPREAEWEYAYRAGARTTHYFDPRFANKYAWTNANAGERTHPVGQLAPNVWGLHDMNGNVWEWCSDTLRDREGRLNRVLRGSSLFNDVELLRTYSAPSRRTFDFGFRVVCQRVQYLSHMEEYDVKAGEGRFAKNGSLGYSAGESGRIKVKRQESPHGLSMHGITNGSAGAKYRLGRKAQTFLASVALNDSAGTIPTRLTFRVLGDGNNLWSSQPIQKSGIVEDCEVEVAGVDVLELRVDCPGAYTNAQAVWLEPRVLLK
jgi:serine/threonine protein kinase